MADPRPKSLPPEPGSDPGAAAQQELRAREIAQQLQGSSIVEILRVQDHLDRLVRDRYERQLAVLFSDIVDSTRYFERRGDAEGRRMVQRHLDLFQPIIVEHGGRVLKTLGDAVMASFPTSQQAVDAA